MALFTASTIALATGLSTASKIGPKIVLKSQEIALEIPLNTHSAILSKMPKYVYIY